MDIFSIIILFAVGSVIARLFKKAGTTFKQTQNQAQGEAMQAKPVPKPAPKPADHRFPPVQKTAPRPVYQEGRNPDAVVASNLGEYEAIKPSAGMDVAFSSYKGSLDTSRTEGIGYQTEAYDDVSAAYQTSARVEAKILPEHLNRDALIQAVVMSEILKRPGASRR
ncbi:MAG TPA: hypothetical protein PKU80_07940 [Candidatus Limiplasma sp.]|nr:hypothetical protein [Candidatus Limiplasma sp.]HRX09907.1 hypothetical protein [Candidatus Limiplasma sp.]